MAGASRHVWCFFILSILCAVLTFVTAVPAAEDWVVRANRQPLREHQEFSRSRRQAVDPDLGSNINVRAFHVDSQIAVRFAIVAVTCHITNGASLPESYVYELIIPPDAYISNFTLIVDDQMYTGQAEDQCFRDDPFAFSSVGATTGTLSASSLTRNLFQVKLNMAPRSQATFIVEYQEVLTRVGGWFTQVISIRPKQTVQDFRITASVVEPQGIERIEAAMDTRTTSSSVIAASFAGYVALPASFGSSTNEFTRLSNELTRIGRTSARFNYQPSTIAQDRYPGNKGIFGDFILRYDVVHSYDVGYVMGFIPSLWYDINMQFNEAIESTGDVFVHYFSPSGYRPIKKNVVFVIDVSGSMYLTKLPQTKEALMTILDEVRITDTFNILPFSDSVSQWRPGEMVRASRREVRDAKRFVAGLNTDKATNINSALLEGLDLLEQTGSMEFDEDDPSICILFLLTDGKPTGEVKSVRQIETNCKNKNRGRCSIVTLGFGADVDFNFLARLALQNKGVARKIYADASATSQLTGVYDEVATPLLYDISVDYLSNVDPSSVSSTTFPNYFNGSEISITGRLIDPSATILPIRINAYGADGQFIIEEDVNLRQQFSRPLSGGDVPDDFPERTWAFLTLSELFKRFTLAEDAAERRVLIDRSLELSQRYNLLTPLMSMALLDSQGNRVTFGLDSNPQSGANRGSSGSLSSGVSAPQGYGWRITGPSFGTRGDSSTYGIGGAECTSPEPSTRPPIEESMIDLYRMLISSKITERYAETEVQAHMINRGTQPEDMEFSYQIPNGAFISDFSVEIDGVVYEGFVQDRRDTTWNNVFARSESGNTVGLQTRRDPSKNMLHLRIPDAEPNNPVIFTVIYDELLQRRQSQYRHAVNIWPGEIIEDLTVDIYVTEPQGIHEIGARYEGRNTASSENIPAIITRLGGSRSRARVTYSPTEEEQRNLNPDGLSGDVVLWYDVEHDRQGSHTQAQDGYFVHFFSPSSIRQAPKHVVFVIDVSASMYGIKLRQVKDSLKIILDDLAPNDRFNIITFSDDVTFWNENRLVPATLTNTRLAKAFVESLTDLDETNLNDAILEADRLLDNEARFVPESDKVLSLMILLTDGKPSQGVIDKDQILQNAREAIQGQHALYALGYGQDVDFDLLIQLALQNRGFARKIYETGAVNRELRDVYLEVSQPLLFDVVMGYEDGVLDEDTLTRHQFPIHFAGSELVVASKVSQGSASTLDGTVQARTSSGQLTRSVTTDLTSTHQDLQRDSAVPKVIEKIWAVKTLEALIDEYSITQDEERKRAIADAVVEIAQAYNLVTPLTPIALYDPNSGSLLTGSTRDPVPLPTVSHAESSLSRMGDAVKYDPLPNVVKPPTPPGDAPLVIESTSGIMIDRLHAVSLISLRYALTRIEQDMTNRGSRPGQAVFKQKIPLNAFITGITVTIDGKTYDGQVEDLLDTSTLTLGTLERGTSGGIVTPIDYEGKVVILAIPLQPDQTATFTLDYEMLIPRRRGVFEHKVSLFPEQIVNNILVDTAIVEPQGLSGGNAFLNDKSLRGNPEDLSYLFDKLTANRWQIEYRPSTRRQRALSEDGLAGDFVIQYDTNHDYDAGDIQISDNYFVHLFSPSGLAVLRKNVVFVIDISDSMAGAKLQQVKDALKTILDDMRPNDKFNILPFHSQVEFLDRYKMLAASRANILTAKRFVDNLVEQEATNLNKAIIEGVNQLRREDEKNRGVEKVVSMLIVLTDGEPTYGEKELALIERNVREVIGGDYSLFALGFGEDVDFPFLTRLALQNHGVARKIPATADASLLLEGFYEEVASPLLYDLEFHYSYGIQPQSLSELLFANYFNGSELVVVGKLLPNLRENVLESTVIAKTATETLTLTSSGNIRNPPVELLTPDIPDDLLAKIWAYYMIQGFLQTKEEKEDSPEYSAQLDRDIIDFSLQNQFFNPYTAYIVNDPMAPQEAANRQIAMRIIEDTLPVNTQESLRQIFGTGAQDLTIGNGGSSSSSTNSGSGVDGDPHFLVHLPKSDLKVCFDISSADGSVLSLLQDPKRGLYVNGKVMGAPVYKDGVTLERSFIGEVAMLWWFSQKKLPYEILFTPNNITVRNNHVLHWGKQMRLKHKGLKLHINGKHAKVTLQHNVTFTVLRHKTPPQKKGTKPDYLGFFLEHFQGLSDGAHGLIGQFKTVKAELRPKESEIGRTADLIIRGHTVHVREGSRHHSLQMKRHTCWKAENNGAGVIQGQYTDYLMSHLFGTD